METMLSMDAHSNPIIGPLQSQDSRYINSNNCWQICTKSAEALTTQYPQDRHRARRGPHSQATKNINQSVSSLAPEHYRMIRGKSKKSRTKTSSKNGLESNKSGNATTEKTNIHCRNYKTITLKADSDLSDIESLTATFVHLNSFLILMISKKITCDIFINISFPTSLTRLARTDLSSIFRLTCWNSIIYSLKIWIYNQIT